MLCTYIQYSYGNLCFILLEDVIKTYQSAQSNFSILENSGASHLHEVDATKMKFHSGLKARKFDRIIFNFPHAGFYGREDDALLIV